MLKAFGSNGNGQLGIGSREDTHVPTRCVGDFPTTAPPKTIAAGGNHTLVLFPCGSLFAAGENTYGQCAILPALGTSFTEFQLVSAPPDGAEGWECVSAGWEFSIIVSKAGGVYACGRGELGLGAAHTTANLQQIPPFSSSRTVCLASGMAHTLAVLEDGSVHGWGAGRKGQLGEREKIVHSPRKVEVGFPVAAAACGREFSFVISREGKQHRVLGDDGRFGVCSTAPQQGELAGWKTVGAGWGCVMVLLADGSVRSWGRNDRGQLPPEGLSGALDLAVGSEHGVAILSQSSGGRLVAWGWGEHGNCGKSRDADGGDVVGGVYSVRVADDGDDDARLARAGAGCATSWVWTE